MFENDTDELVQIEYYGIIIGLQGIYNMVHRSCCQSADECLKLRELCQWISRIDNERSHKKEVYKGD